MTKRTMLFAAAAAAGAALAALRRRGPALDLFGRTALITGGSRGLGLLMGRELVSQGCRVAFCARDGRELEEARRDLEDRGGVVLAYRCDISRREEAEAFAAAARERFGGRIDILINNAGVIQVGPIENMTVADFESAMGVMFWGMVYPTLAVLPDMLERGEGRIVNITSIGGKLSMPHLVPYGSAKFAAVGFSEGLRAELKGRGVLVTTIAPGLMRTGSYLNAWFKGQPTREAVWFGLGASLPGISMGAERAAKQVIAAMKRGESEKILSLPASAAARFHGLFPGLTTDLLALVNGLLPEAGPSPERRMQGRAAQAALDSRAFNAATVLSRRAAGRNHEVVV